MISDATLTPSFFWLKFPLGDKPNERNERNELSWASGVKWMEWIEWNEVIEKAEILIRKMMELKLRQKSSSYNYSRSDKENFLIHGELTETNKGLLFFSELGSNINFRRFLLNPWC